MVQHAALVAAGFPKTKGVAARQRPFPLAVPPSGQGRVPSAPRCRGVIALSPCGVILADHSKLRSITERAPHPTRLLWLDTPIDGAIHREWIVAMGRRSKVLHLAHLFCKLFVRLQVVKRTNGMAFHLPVSQAELSDVLGPSVVHMNRVISALRNSGAIGWASHTVTILDWQKLQQIAEFDPTYLSMTREPR
ncbi:Crp/Fnr family transcriptional regulator [Mesorhizobium sp. B4-1-1]|nr:Crp/Fnr family transcriptional regulator [Mesorhizobium sp. B4-1-1]